MQFCFTQDFPNKLLLHRESLSGLVEDTVGNASWAKDLKSPHLLSGLQDGANKASGPSAKLEFQKNNG